MNCFNKSLFSSYGNQKVISSLIKNINCYQNDKRFKPDISFVIHSLLVKGEIDFFKAIIVEVNTEVADLFCETNCDNLSTQYLFGQKLLLLGEFDKLAYVLSLDDFYVGFMYSCDIKKNIASTKASLEKYFVENISAISFSQNSIKSCKRQSFSFATFLELEEIKRDFLYNENYGYIPKQWVKKYLPKDLCADKLISLGKKFLGVPYLWGGRSSFGIDCSAFIQLLFSYFGYNLPRDSDLLETVFPTIYLSDNESGKSLSQESSALSNLKKGDLIHWQGHIAIMLDSQHIIHANATKMIVSIDELELFATKVKDETGAIRSITRPPFKHKN